MRVYNFNSGPALLPVSILNQAQEEFLNFNQLGISILEMSHRSSDFEFIVDQTQNNLRILLEIPQNYSILFLQGGARFQFFMIPYNLSVPDKPIGFIHTGEWSKQAMEEAQKISPIEIIASNESNLFRQLPPNIKINDEKYSYIHMVSNNTIYGTQWKTFPHTQSPLVADMSSDILSRKINVNQFGLIFAGAQKNLGPSGVTLVIIRNDLIKDKKQMPLYFSYEPHFKSNSLYNTPPTFGIYMIYLMTQWLLKQGGVESVEKSNQIKSQLLYQFLDQSIIYDAPVELNSRSTTNIIFSLNNSYLNHQIALQDFLKIKNIIGIKGHRVLGGFRASCYNAQPIQAIEYLIEQLKTFENSLIK